MRTTWAPRGQTPILHHPWRRRDNLSVVGLICYHPDGRRVRLLVGHVVGAYHTNSLIPVLQRLPALVHGDPVILVWDGLSAHRSTDMKAWLAAQTGWLQVIELPATPPTSILSRNCGPRSKAKTWPTTPPPTSPTYGPPPTAACNASAATPLYCGPSSPAPAYKSHQPDHENSLVVQPGNVMSTVADV